MYFTTHNMLYYFRCGCGYIGIDMAKKTGKKKSKLIKKKSTTKPVVSIAASTIENETPPTIRETAVKEPAPGLSIPSVTAPLSNPLTAASKALLDKASILLALATGIAILFGLSMAALPGGNDAVPAMGGVLKATAPIHTAQIVFLLDIIFPITFGAGFALLATAFQTRGNRPLVRMILTALLLVVLADFSENALVFKALTGGETHAVQWPLTVIKYAMLGLSAVLLSTIIVVRGTLGLIANLFLRYVFPISIALLVAGVGGRTGSDIVGASFPLGLLLLAVYAKTLSTEL